MQQEEPDDYVLATGESTQVRTFVEWAFEAVGMRVEWDKTGAAEKGYCGRTGDCLVEVDPRYFRPTEVDLLIGDPSKAKQRLGWSHETSVRDLVREMVAADMAALGSTPAAFRL